MPFLFVRRFWFVRNFYFRPVFSFRSNGFFRPLLFPDEVFRGGGEDLEFSATDERRADDFAVAVHEERRGIACEVFDDLLGLLGAKHIGIACVRFFEQIQRRLVGVVLDTSDVS